MSAPDRSLPQEPLLDLGRIQGIAIPGFFKPHQTLLCVRYTGLGVRIGKVKTLLRYLTTLVSNGEETLDDRQAFRAHPEKAAERAPLMAIAFTYPGLCGLTESAIGVGGVAFQQGLPGRSALLGDPVDPGVPGHPSTWHVGGPDAIPDFMVVIAGNTRATVDAMAVEVSDRIEAAGLDVHCQKGDKHSGSDQGREHFGFADGVSQPGIRGRDSREPNDFITERHIAPDEWPESALYGYPGQELVWPGEFVLGQAKTGPDPLMPGPIAKPDVDWMKNGSYLVYNRLLQDVGLFWRTMREQALALAELPGFEGIVDEGLAARIVGRCQDGTPLSRLVGTERAFHDGIGAEPLFNNHFRFDSDTPKLNLLDRENREDRYAQALADPLGMRCPLASHIRKVNPRDSASDLGGESAAYQHRILRVGVPFGPVRQDRYADPIPHEHERGLLFLSIQASIEDQFEFLQARWMNDERRPKSPGGHDMLAGRSPADSDGVRRCTIFGAEGQAARVEAADPFVIPSGGGYFFVPSLDALRTVLAAR